jgi:hypothetical protein
MRLTNLICRIELRAPVCPASLDIQSTSTSSTSDPLSLLGSTDFPSTYPLASSIPQHATGSLLDSHAPDSFLRSIMPNIDTTETASTPLSPDSDPQAFQFSASSSSLPPSTSPQRRNHTRSHRLPSPPERSTVEPLAESESASDSTVTGKVSVPSRNLFGSRSLASSCSSTFRGGGVGLLNIELFSLLCRPLCTGCSVDGPRG